MKCKDVLTENKKENIYVAVEKQQRKGKTDRKWRADEETGGWKLYETQNWDTGTYCPYLRSYDTCLRCIFV